MGAFEEIINKLKTIHNQGFIKTHRAGNTGIGKTLEDLLGIAENNIPGPDMEEIELKTVRSGSISMLTLFTKSPLPRNTNSRLLTKFGYWSSHGSYSKELNTTVNAKDFNKLAGKPGFKIDIKDEKLRLMSSGWEEQGYWDINTLKICFERKFPKLLYIKADYKGKGRYEEFWYNEGWLLSGFSFRNFLKLLKYGTILVDIRIGQYPEGGTHDHGTAFRVLHDDLDQCFYVRRRIL
jgi:hypothetical protein